MPDNFFNLNNPDFYGTMLRFGIDLIFLIILVRGIYFKYSKKEKFVFTFLLTGITVFFITSMLNNVWVEMAMAFALFAVFGVLRYRTRNFSLKDMSYIFTVIGLSVINALKLVGFPQLGVIFINIIIVIAAVMLERFSMNNNTTTHSIVYENLELLKAAKRQKLLKDVSDLTGKDIMRIKIRNIDFKEKVAILDIYFKE